MRIPALCKSFPQATLPCPPPIVQLSGIPDNPTSLPRLFPLLVLLAVLLLLSATLPQAHAAQEKKAEQGIYVWTDEHGVVHMQDKKPEHLVERPSRMEQRQRFLQKHPETRNQTEALASGDSQLSHENETEIPANGSHLAAPSPGATGGQEPSTYNTAPGAPFQGFQPQTLLSPQQMLMAMAVPLLVGLAIYVASCYVLYRIGRKFGIGSFPGYLVPIYNMYLLCRCADFPGWFLLFFFVPLINIFMTFLLWGKIAERLGKDMLLWGLLCTLLGVPVIILAFDRSTPWDRLPAPKAEETPSIYI